jgi:plastocyanin domain-containing protein
MKSIVICLGVALTIPLAGVSAPQASRIAMTDKPSDVNASAARRVEVSITKKGFEPAKITAKKGEPLRLVVTRRTDQTCAKEIVIADAGIQEELPLDRPVTIDFTPRKNGELRYACGMNMISGVIVVQ